MKISITHAETFYLDIKVMVLNICFLLPFLLSGVKLTLNVFLFTFDFGLEL